MKIIRPTAITDNAGSFTRSTTATYFNNLGVLTTAAINVPRHTHVYNTDSELWDTRGILLESASTNYILYSDDFSNAEWGKTECTITANGVTGPTNTATGDLLIPSTNNVEHFISQSETLANGEYTASTFIRVGGGYDRGQFYMNNGTSSIGLTFDLGESTASLFGNTVEWTNSSIGIERFGQDWFRVYVTATKTAGTLITWRLLVHDSAGNSTFTGNGTSSIGIYGAQLEAGKLSSYIPTTTVAVTRAADVCTGTGFIYSNLVETDHAAWVSGTTYALGDRVIRTTATTHSIYERVVAGAGTTTPESDPNKWIRVGPTNRWSAFDDSPSTLSSGTEFVTYILKPGKINSVALLEVDASQVAINFYTDDGGVVEEQYYAYKDLQDNSGIGNWYEYFYEPFYYQTSVATTDMLNASLLDLPQYSNTILCVTIRKPLTTTSVGIIATGIVYGLGKTQNGMSVSIIDYSKKDVDTYGNTVLVRRKFSKRVSASFFLYSSKVDVVSNLLTQYRATPVVWIGADAQYSSLVVYGFYRDWNIGIPNNIGSTCTIEIEGLT